MQFVDNFVPLTNYRLVDPMLKVAVQSGRFNLEDSTHDFDVYYDPEIDADHLWQRMPEDEIQRLIRFNMPRRKDDLIPFVSNKKSSIMPLLIKEEPDGDDLILDFIGDELAYARLNQYVMKSNTPILSHNSQDFIRYVIEATFKWYSLEEFTPGGFRNMKRLRFLMDGSFARRLTGQETWTSAEASGGRVIYGTREIA